MGVARLENPRAILLDIGGPVYDDENFLRAIRTAVDELRSRRGLPPVPELEVRAVYDEMRVRQGGSIRRELASVFLQNRSLAGELGRRTKAHWCHPVGTMYPDVLPFLRAVRARAKVAIVANQEASVVDNLTRDGVAPFIDAWGVSAIVGFEKPSPELFRWALAETDSTPDEAIHIGNRLDTDVRPAQALGLGTVWVLRGEAPDEPTAEQLAEPDLAVRSLDELAVVLFP